jgi:hypothetical protein
MAPVPVASCALIRRFARPLSVSLDSFAYLEIPILQRALLAGCVRGGDRAPKEGEAHRADVRSRAAPVLVSAFLVVPAAAGRLIGRSLTGVVGWAMLMGVLGVSLGFVVAHRLEWPQGAAIVLLLAVIFAAAAGWRRVRA